jgi:hypothetical protein
MAIYCDPSEFSVTSRNPKAFLDAATKLNELEEATGADWLLSTLSVPKLEVLDDSKACQIKLRKHMDHGCLVQRKTTDLAASLPELKRILSEMQTQKPKYGCWLLVVGDIYEKDGKPCMDGQEMYGLPNLTYQNLLMTFAKWQFRGGLIAHVKYDRDILPWVTGMLGLMQKIEDEPETTIEIHAPVQSILGGEQSLYPWRRTLMSLPGIRTVRALAVAEHCQTLAKSLCYLTDPVKIKDEHVEGIGRGTVDTVRSYMGLGDGDYLQTYNVWDTYPKQAEEIKLGVEEEQVTAKEDDVPWD